MSDAQVNPETRWCEDCDSKYQDTDGHECPDKECEYCFGRGEVGHPHDVNKCTDCNGTGVEQPNEPEDIMDVLNPWAKDFK